MGAVGEVTMALGRPIVGIVADVHRHMEGHHYAEVSSVFGLDSEEFLCLQQAGVKIKPAQFEKAADRFQVHCSPWTIMRHLGTNFGYVIPVMPIGGLVESSNAGERRTCVFTIQKRVV